MQFAFGSAARAHVQTVDLGAALRKTHVFAAYDPQALLPVARRAIWLRKTFIVVVLGETSSIAGPYELSCTDVQPTSTRTQDVITHGQQAPGGTSRIWREGVHGDLPSSFLGRFPPRQRQHL